MKYLDDPEKLIEYIKTHEVYSKIRSNLRLLLCFFIMGKL